VLDRNYVLFGIREFHVVSTLECRGHTVLARICTTNPFNEWYFDDKDSVNVTANPVTVDFP